MRLECQECHRTLNLPDAKLPVGRPFAFNCPYCKHKNTALIPEPAPEESSTQGSSTQESSTQESSTQESATWSEPPAVAPAEAAAPAAVRTAAPPPPEPLRPQDDGLEQPAPRETSRLDLQAVLSEVVDDRPKAIVVYDDPEIQDLLISKLEGLGYRASAALNPRDAAKQLKFANFSLLALQEDYCGTSLRGNLLLRSVQTLDIGNRRGMLVVLISPTMVSLDDLTAFGLSIDAIVNVSDLDSIDRLLVSITARADKFYAVYREMLAEHGLA